MGNLIITMNIGQINGFFWKSMLRRTFLCKTWNHWSF